MFIQARNSFENQIQLTTFGPENLFRVCQLKFDIHRSSPVNSDQKFKRKLEIVARQWFTRTFELKYVNLKIVDNLCFRFIIRFRCLSHM